MQNYFFSFLKYSNTLEYYLTFWRNVKKMLSDDSSELFPLFVFFPKTNLFCFFNNTERKTRLPFHY